MSRRVLVTGGSGFIGTNLVEHLRQRGDTVVNVDLATPRNPAHASLWRETDLLDPHAVRAAFAAFAPTHLVHLGARTDLGGSARNDYRVNDSGTDHVIDAAEQTSTMRSMVLASSMLVCPNGHAPTGPDDLCPDTAYGESKASMERSVRSRTDLDIPWVLVRPTSIWGPWFAEPYRPFFETVLSGRYVHPGSRQVVKALGFVGNTCLQLETLMDDPRFDGQVVYLCDTPAYSIDEWANAIADASDRRRPRTVPVGVLRLAALAGDLARRTGVMATPPLTSFRLGNMLTESSFDITELTAATGPLPHSLYDGIELTLDWLATQDR